MLKEIKEYIQGQLPDAEYKTVFQTEIFQELEVKYESRMLLVTINAQNIFVVSEIDLTDDPCESFFTPYPDIEFQSLDELLVNIDKIILRWLAV